MPAAPELLDALRGIGTIEVLREADAEQQRQADRHIGVAREVAVDLGGVAVDRQEHVGTGVLLRHREDGVDEIARKEVGDGQLLEEPEADQHDARPDRDLAAIPRRLHLRQELRGAHDRSGDEVREEAEVEREVQQRAGLHLAAPHVDHVRDRLEGVEAHACRQRELHQRDREREAHVAAEREHLLSEEAVVLKRTEHEQIGDDGGRDDLALPTILTGAGDCARGQLVGDGHRREQQAEAHVGRRVEHVAGDQHRHLPRTQSTHERPREGQHEHEEERELGGREDHAVENVAGPPTACVSGPEDLQLRRAERRAATS